MGHMQKSNSQQTIDDDLRMTLYLTQTKPVSYKRQTKSEDLELGEIC